MAIKKSSINFSALDNLFGGSTSTTKTESQVIGKKKAALDKLDNIFGESNKPFEPAWSPPKEPSAFQKMLSSAGSAISSGVKTVATKVSNSDFLKKKDTTSTIEKLFPNAKSNTIAKNNENLVKVKGAEAAPVNQPKKSAFTPFAPLAYGVELYQKVKQKEPSTSVWKNLPQAIVDNLPLGLSEVAQSAGDMSQDEIEQLKGMSATDFAKIGGQTLWEFGKGILSTPVRMAASISMKDKIDVPVLGEVESYGAQAKRDIEAYTNNGMSPTAAAITATIKQIPNIIFDTLLVAGVAEKAATPKEATILSGNAKLFPKSNKIGAQGVKPEPTYVYVSKDTPLGSTLHNGISQSAPKYNSNLPTFLKLEYTPEGYVGSVVQVKPSVLNRSINFSKSGTANKPINPKIINSNETVVSSEIIPQNTIVKIIGESKMAPAPAGGSVPAVPVVRPNVASGAKISPVEPVVAPAGPSRPSNVSVDELPDKISALDNIFSEANPIGADISPEVKSTAVSPVESAPAYKSSVRPEDLVVKKEVKNDIYLEKSGDNYLFQEASLKKLVRAVKGTDSRISDENAYSKASVALKQANEAFSSGQNAVQITEIGGRRLETPIRLVKAEMKGKLPEDLVANAKPGKTEKINPEQFKYSSWSQEMEGQYDAFKKVMLRFPNPKVRDKLTNGDAETFKNVVKKYGISPERVDNMLYDQTKTNHEVFEEFLDRFYNRNKPVDDLDAKFEQYYNKLKEGGKTDEQLLAELDSMSPEDIFGNSESIDNNKLDSLIKQTEEQIQKYENQAPKAEVEAPASKEVKSNEDGGQKEINQSEKRIFEKKIKNKYPRYVSPEQWTSGLSDKFGNTVKLYHQTDAANVPDILKNGFKSGEEFGDDVFFVMEEKIDRVGGKGSDYLVVEVPKSYYDRLFPDERSMSDIFTEKESELDGDSKEQIMRSYILNDKTSKGFDILMNADEIKPEWIKKVKSNPFEKKLNLTLKTFDWLEGKETVSKQYIQDLTNRGDIKQVERDIIRESLETEGDKINVSDFIQKVQNNLLPLKRIDLGETGDLMNGDVNLKYEFVALPGDIRGSVSNYSEVIYESPVKTSAGSIHFRDTGTEKYFGHVRYEDMAIGAKKTGVDLDGNPIYDMPPQYGNTELRRIIEVQTDLYQKGRMENESITLKEELNKNLTAKEKEFLTYIANKDTTSPQAFFEAVPSDLFSRDKLRVGLSDKELFEYAKSGFTDPNKGLQKLQQYNDPSAHFRLVREEIKNAANQGVQRLQFPTGETAMKVEGLARSDSFNLVERKKADSEFRFYVKDKLTPDKIKEGQEIQGNGNNWVIIEALEGEKFKAIPKKIYDDMTEAGGGGLNRVISSGGSITYTALDYVETFDLSPKVDSSNPIYKFYQKDLGRYLTSKYGAKVVTDENGVSWFEMNVKPEYAERPVEAFQKTIGRKWQPNTSVEKAKAELEKMFTKADVVLITREFGTPYAPDRTKAWGVDMLGNYQDGVIRVVMSNGKVNDRTVYHEAFHHYINTYHPILDAGNLINQAYKENKGLADELYEGYEGTSDARGEELLADWFAEYAAGKKTFVGKIKSFFDSIIRKIKSLFDSLKAKDKAKDLFEVILSGKARNMEAAPLRKNNTIFMKKNKAPKPSELSSQEFKTLEKVNEKVFAIKTKVKVPESIASSLIFWNDKRPILLTRETMERNLDDVAGDFSPNVKEFLTEKIRLNETMRSTFVTALRTEIENYIVKKLGIKKGSDLSSLVQRFGEGEISQKELMEKTDKWAQVIEASEYLRKVYDNMIDKWNNVRESYGYQPVPKRKDYFRHGQFISSISERLGMILSENELPTSISGITAMFNPGTPFSTAAMKRTGFNTDYDAVAGIDNYIDAVSRSMFHTDSVQRGRSLEKVIRKSYEIIEENNLEINKRNKDRIDQNSNETLEATTPNVELTNFVANLNEYTNLISGKKAQFDRAFESIFGRSIYGVFNQLRSRTSANMIGGNISSAITNFIPVTQLLATTNKVSVAKGLAEVPKGISDARIIDGQKSGFLSRRFMKEKIGMSPWDKTKAGLNYMFKAVDLFTSRWVVASKYYENLSKGMSRADALREADNYAGNVITDRSIGQLPNLFGIRTMGVFTQFQTEINNQWSFITKDIPMMSKGNKLKYLSMMIQFFIYSYLFNELYEKIIGRRPAIDPIYDAMTLAGQTVEGKDKSITKRSGIAIEDIAGNLPFTGGVTGGRLPISAGMPDILGALKGDTNWQKEISKPLFYLAFPAAGGQVKKTYEGLSAYNKGGSYSKAGLLQFPIDQTQENLIKTGVFGKYSTGDAKLYYGEERSPLGKNQTKEYQRLLQYNPSQARPYYDRIIDKREKKRDN